MPDPAELVDVALTDDERFLLTRGLVEWGGPARCSDAMAVAMGFADVQDLLRQGDRIVEQLDARLPLSRRDWLRTLLATEIVFVSDAIGSGVEWSVTTGLDDVRSLQILRSVQGRLVGVIAAIRGDEPSAQG